MATCRICDSEVRRGRGKRVLVGRKTSRRVCDDCASMVEPPEEAAPSGGRRASSYEDEPATQRAAEPPSSERPTVRARAATTVALASRGRLSAATVAVYVALGVAALAGAAIVRFLASSAPR